MKYAIVHLADIHYRKDEPEGSELIINSFLNDLEILINKMKDYDFILALTGDIVHDASDIDSYIQFILLFNEKLSRIGISKNKRILVPGNHDIDRTIIEKHIETYSEKIKNVVNDERKFNNFIRSDDYLKDIFLNYGIFESEFSEYGVSDNFSGKGWTIKEDLSFYCLNTAISSFGGINKIDDKNKLGIDTRQLEEWCNEIDTTCNVLLSHHHFDHLTPWSKNELLRIIENKFPLCLNGHDHKQNLYSHKITSKSIICSAPQLFTKKGDNLGYSIICIESKSIEKILYRQYLNGKFLNGQIFTGNDDGVVILTCDKLHCIQLMKDNLDEAMAFFKGHVGTFVKPKLSNNREFNDDENLLDELMANPTWSIIVAQPQFGLTCLSLFMRLEAFKDDNFWIYIDAKHDKSRNIDNIFSTQLTTFNKHKNDLKCIIIDSWNDAIIDNRSILININNKFPETPIIITSNYNDFSFKTEFDFAKLNHEYKTLHLQALPRDKVREFVSTYNSENTTTGEDIIISRIVSDLEMLNIHRTPLNCLTLLKVAERDYGENIINRSKMIKAVLFILFTDSDSFTYSSNKPNVDECEFIIGKFCSELLMNKIQYFNYFEFIESLNDTCKDNLIHVDIDLLVDILLSNNIMLRFSDQIEFKHSYWIYYFSAMYMFHDDKFKQNILNNKVYVNYPEIIEFYTGHDGRRNDAIDILLYDLKELIDNVDNKIGIKGEFNPLSNLVWDPSDKDIESIKTIISDKIKDSNLPANLKDRQADTTYNSEAPYNQSINKFFTDYSVVSLLQSVKASSNALRNSNYVKKESRKELLDYVIKGWESLSKVFFLISPKLAVAGRAVYDGLGVTLLGDFDESKEIRLKEIITCNPYNVVGYFKDYLSSNKIGPLIYDNFHNNPSDIQRHFIGIYLIKEKPLGWAKEIFEFMNLIHKNSFLISDLKRVLEFELKFGFISEEEKRIIKVLLQIIVAKHKNIRSYRKYKLYIPNGFIINANNKIPYDQIFSQDRKPKFLN